MFCLQMPKACIRNKIYQGMRGYSTVRRTLTRIIDEKIFVKLLIQEREIIGTVKTRK
jgi:hypothetical protein